MTFRATLEGEPVLNGVTHRAASWPSLADAEAWVEYWNHLWQRAGVRPEIIEHTEAA